MWLFSPEGFFTVVTAEEFGHPLMVRARSADDLDRLRKTHFPELGDTVRIPGRDYPVRAFTTHDDLATCMVRLAQAIDYSNFKSTVSARQGHERAHIYGDVWRDCLQIETEEGAP
jgi:hypothetical protein